MNEGTAATVNEAAETNSKLKLWNPNAAINWSLLFSPIFGAWLQAKNWETLGDAEQAKRSMYWVYGGFPFLFFCLFLPDEVGYAPGFIFLVTWYVTTARKQIKHVKETLNNNYEKKSWAAPMKFAGIGMIVFFIIAWIASPSVESILEKQSADLVTQILADQSGDNAECVRVKITEKITDNMYRGTATLDNGNDVTITIRNEDDQIVVNLNPFQ